MKITSQNVSAVFAHHPPRTQMDAACHGAIRTAATEFAKSILVAVPACEDRAGALEHIRLAMFFANAAIALEGLI